MNFFNNQGDVYILYVPYLPITDQFSNCYENIINVFLVMILIIG